jgi:uncharacterized protein YcbK (DUF882 family)
MWRFPNFTREEFICPCGCGFDDIDPLIVSTLQRLRDEVQRPVVVNSGCRCRSHNAAVKGNKTSQHLKGKAADIRIDGMTSREIFDVLSRLYLDGEIYVGYVYAINGRSVHVDVRAPQSQVVRRWTR